jgi:diguanylate cyclase
MGRRRPGTADDPITISSGDSMKLIRWRELAVKSTDDPLAPYRLRAMYVFAIVGTVFLTPFVITSFLQGRNALGATVLGIIVAFAIDAVAIQRQKTPPVPYPLLLLPAVVAIGLAMESLGVVGAFWCYPAVLFFYFALSGGMANLCSLTLLLAAALMLYQHTDPTVTIRFAVTMLMTIMVINSILIIISDLQHQLIEQAITDPLTGAFNRRHMDARLDEAIERHRRHPTPAALLVIDIRFGHTAGDTVLKEITSLIKQRSRKIDSLFRIGGEEFMLLLPDTHGTEAANAAEHLRIAIGELALVRDTPITVSIGVSELRSDDSLDTWFRRADDALYAAKNAGRNRVVHAERLHTENAAAAPPAERYAAMGTGTV